MTTNSYSSNTYINVNLSSNIDIDRDSWLYYALYYFLYFVFIALDSIIDRTRKLTSIITHINLTVTWYL
jgi:hypothetical protein